MCGLEVGRGQIRADLTLDTKSQNVLIPTPECTWRIRSVKGRNPTANLNERSGTEYMEEQPGRE